MEGGLCSCVGVEALVASVVLFVVAECAWFYLSLFVGSVRWV